MVPEITVDADGVVLAARMAFAAGKPLKVNGGSGGGKSDISRQIESMLRDEASNDQEEFFFSIFNVALAIQPDVAGFLLPFERTHTTFDGKETFKLREGAYTYPYCLRDEYTGEPAAKYKRGLIVIEEWGQAAPDLKRMLTPMILEHRIGEHKIHPGIHIMLLSNRPKDGSAVTKEYNFTINRWVEVNYQPTREGFNKWVHKYNVDIHEGVFEWVNNGENDDIFSGDPPEKQGPWGTARSVMTMSALLNAAKRQFMLDINNSVVFANVAGAVGVGKASSYAEHEKMAHMLPTYDEVVQSPTRAKLPPPDRSDAIMVVTHRLANKMKSKDAEKVVTYVKRLPKAFGVPFVKMMLARDRDLFLNEHVGAWSRENADVLAVVNTIKVK